MTNKHVQLPILIKDEMAFQDTSFSLLVIETKRLEHSGLNSSMMLRHLLISLMGQSNVLSLSLTIKWASNGTVSSSKLGSHTVSLGQKVWEERKSTIPLSLRVAHSIGNSLTHLTDAKAIKKQVFQVRCLSANNFRGLHGGQVKLLRTRDRFYLVA